MIEINSKIESTSRSMMGIRGELNIMSEQVFDTDRKAEEALNQLRSLGSKADKEDIVKISTRF